MQHETNTGQRDSFVCHQGGAKTALVDLLVAPLSFIVIVDVIIAGTKTHYRVSSSPAPCRRIKGTGRRTLANVLQAHPRIILYEER